MERIRQWSSRIQGYRGAPNSQPNEEVEDGYEIQMNKADDWPQKDASRLGARQVSASEDAILLAPSDAENSSSRSQSPTDPKSVPASTKRKLKILTSGWRTGITYWLAAATLAFLLNLFTTIGLMSTYDMDGDGIGVVMEGQCSRVKTASLWVHVAINILSTTLLSASNYCMQVLTSPSREEVDRAHREGKWLDIGVQSIRNLFMIRSKRMWLWLVLALSSVPLHLMYNSIIFQSLNSQKYQAFVVTEDFLTGDGSWDLKSADMTMKFRGSEYTSEGDTGRNLLSLKRSASSLERLSPEDCIRSYGTDIVSNRKNVLLVTTDTTTTADNANNTDLPMPIDESDSLKAWYESESKGVESYLWLCSDTIIFTGMCDVSQLLGNTTRGDPWKLGTFGDKYTIDYCLSERVDERCRLQFSFPIMIVVIICNLGKAIPMLFILWKRAAKPLTNIGDAAASFLETTDHTTAGLCLSSKKDFPKATSWTKSSLLTSRKGRQTWRPTRPWWFAVPGIKRWILTLSPAIIALAVAGKLLQLGIDNLGGRSKTDIASLASMGLGAINSFSVLNDDTTPEPFLPTSLTGFILLANLPQLIVSIIYFAFNSLFTCMVLAHEWNSYAYKRKPLRVADPSGQQRSTYYLSLPYSYAIPLMAMSGLLHWLVSQSFFLVRMDEYDTTGAFKHSISNCGYSCIAIILAILIGGLLILSALGMGCRRYRPGIPAAGSCSAAISAACHPPPGDRKAATLPVQWGAVELFENSNGVGHCTFSSREVSMPVAKRVYAGVK